jgi:RNA polymerase sigma factor (sigma-70 family)
MRLLRCLRRLSAPSAADTDAVLLGRFAQRRDEDAFADLVARHGPMVLNVCRRVLGDAHAAEDAYQATFLVLARKAGSVRRPDALAGWLYGVASRVARKARSAGARRREGALAGTPEPPDPRPDPLAELTARDLLRVLEEEVQRLPEAYRLPVVLCCLEGLSQEEAARRLCWTAGAVKGRLERGRRRLRERLARRGLALSAALAVVEVTHVGAAGVPALPAAAPARVLALAEGALRSSTAGKWQLAVGLLVAAVVVAAGAAGLAYPRREPSAAPRPRAEEKAAHTDRYGDPLPLHALARLGTVRFRPGGPVAGVAFSPDGKLIASGGYDGFLRLTDSTSGKEVRRFGGGLRGCVVAFAPDGKTLASASLEGQVSLWEAATGKAVHSFDGQRGHHRPGLGPGPGRSAQRGPGAGPLPEGARGPVAGPGQGGCRTGVPGRLALRDLAAPGGTLPGQAVATGGSCGQAACGPTPREPRQRRVRGARAGQAGAGGAGGGGGGVAAPGAGGHPLGGGPPQRPAAPGRARRPEVARAATGAAGH